MILVLPSPAPIEIGRARAPDGLPWPPIFGVAVDTSEQDPLAFGYHPAAWETDAPVHYGNLVEKPDAMFDRLRKTRLPYPWRSERCNLGEGDYALLDPRTGKPIPQWCAIETKRGDFVSSMTAGHDRLEAEMARLAGYAFPALVASCSVERLIGADGQETAAGMRERAAQVAEREDFVDAGECASAVRALSLSSGVPLTQPRAAMGKEASLIGTMLALSRRYRIPWYPMPTRVIAEYTVAWLLAEAWKTWLVEVPEGLRECRRLAECERAAKGEAVRA